MTRKQKQAKKAPNSSKRATVPAQPEEETDTAIQSTVAEDPQTTSATPEAEIAVDSLQENTLTAPASRSISAIP